MSESVPAQKKRLSLTVDRSTTLNESHTDIVGRGGQKSGLIRPAHLTQLNWSGLV